MPSLTVENYLKAALQISLRTEAEWVSTGRLAEALSVSPGTVTSMLKTLAESGLATYKPYEGMRLTEAGRRLALRVLRRHRLIELFLVQTLDLSWDQVHAEAENMEHAVSDFLVDRIDEFLNHPTADPHGDPIPSASGEMRGDALAAVPLVHCPAGTRVRFVRVVNQDPDFLRYLTDAGLELSAEGTVEQNNREAGVVVARIGERLVTLGASAAQTLLVEVCRGESR
jgi:DtxR family transcriptional regulator, Mn-dependent transcriptional regulator